MYIGLKLTTLERIEVRSIMLHMWNHEFQVAISIYISEVQNSISRALCRVWQRDYWPWCNNWW